MRLRPLIFYLYAIGFLVALGATMSIPDTAWKYLEWWQVAIYAYSLLLAFVEF